jgi:hypothetical protein
VSCCERTPRADPGAAHLDWNSGRFAEFQANRKSLDPARYNETFCRMWEYWLSAAVAAARASDGALYQVIVHNDRGAPIRLHRV